MAAPQLVGRAVNGMLFSVGLSVSTNSLTVAPRGLVSWKVVVRSTPTVGVVRSDAPV